MASRPIWSGAITFGLLHIPVQLMTGERGKDLSFHMVDSRNNARVRYQRINAENGEEVPWKNISKAFEYEKGSYVVLKEEDFKRATPDSAESVVIESFIDPDEIGPEYMERPYYLVPGKKAEKGYVLLRETLKEENKVGLARVALRSREYLALLRPLDEALQLVIIRYPEEVVPKDEYSFPEKNTKSYKISEREVEMARQLVQSMSGKWNPKQHKDEYHDKLSKAIKARMRQAGAKVQAKEPEAEPVDTGKVVDFMSLLKKSIETQKRTPAKSPPRATHRAARASSPRRAPQRRRKSRAA